MIVNFTKSNKRLEEQEKNRQDDEYIRLVGGEMLSEDMQNMLRLSREIGIRPEQITISDVKLENSLVHKLSPKERRKLIMNLNNQ